MYELLLIVGNIPLFVRGKFPLLARSWLNVSLSFRFLWFWLPSFAGVEGSFFHEAFSKMCRKIVAQMVLDEGRRVDGRNLDQVQSTCLFCTLKKLVLMLKMQAKHWQYSKI